MVQNEYNDLDKLELPGKIDNESIDSSHTFKTALDFINYLNVLPNTDSVEAINEEK